MSLRREIRYTSILRELFGGGTSSNRRAQVRDRAAEAGRARAIKQGQANIEKAAAEAVERRRVAQERAAREKAAAEEGELRRRRHMEEVVNKFVEALDEEGYYIQRQDIDGLPGIIARKPSGEVVYFTVDADGKALLDLDHFKDRSCEEFRTRIDAHMAKRGFVVAEERTEHKADERSFRKKSQKRKEQRCIGQ